MTQPHHGALPISAQEWGRVAVFAVCLLVVTSLPYLVGFASQTADLQFGGFTFGVEDGNSYLAKMRQGANGAWLFQIDYTSEPHEGAFVFVPYLLLGKLTALFANTESPQFTVALIVVFQLARLICSLLLIGVLYRFIAVFLRHPTSRLITLILICIGGGLGWLLILTTAGGNWLDSAPIDFILPEGYSFYLFYGLPHLLLARAGLLGGLLISFAALRQDRPARWIPLMLGAGGCWLVMGLCVPFYTALLYLLLGIWGLTAWIATRRFPTALFWRVIVGALIPLPYLLYGLSVFSTNPILGAWQGQNRLPSPHPLHYLMGYGLVAVPAMLALRWAWRRGITRPAYHLLVGWIVAAPLLAYLPGINVQRRMLEAVFVPLCLLCIAALRIVLRNRRQPLRHQLLTAMLCVVWSASTILLLVSGLQTARTPDLGNQLFVPRPLIVALSWLDGQTSIKAVVFSSAPIGNLVPAWSNLQAYVGHGPETINFAAKRDQAEQFFGGALSQAQMTNLLRDPALGIDYLVLTEAAWERVRALLAVAAQGEGIDQSVELIYNQDGYVVLRNRRG